MTAFVHQALAYDGVSEFVQQTMPFVQDGLDASEPVFAVTNNRNIGALRDALGDAANEVEFCSADDWYTTPSRTLLAYSRYVDRYEPGTRVRVIGEPVWHGRSDAAIREWTRYESILNTAFASSAAWILCPYDRGVLDPEIVEYAHATHPEVCSAGSMHRSPHYMNPRELSALLDAAELEPPPLNTVELPLDLGLRALRTFAREHALASGMQAGRAAEVELAVHEVVANALVHGHGMGVLRTWANRDELVCEVADCGRGLGDPLAGHLPPDPQNEGRFGLWIARQLSDLVEVRSTPTGACVRMRFTKPPLD